jgi:hypothetical protein
MSDHLEEIKQLLASCNEQQRREVFHLLRREFRIHPIEEKLNVQAEVILEAIDRAGDLTLRGIRGIIAEAAFLINVVGKLEGWKNITTAGDHPYDFLLTDGRGDLRVQVKMQRQKDQRPMPAREGYRFLPADMYVVETQRTRGGTDQRTGENTRPYRFGEFDILAVSLHPSTNDWTRFCYTVSSWLLPRPENRSLLLKFQPVPARPNEDWTDDFLTCVGWFRAGQGKRIQPGETQARRTKKPKTKKRRPR